MLGSQTNFWRRKNSGIWISLSAMILALLCVCLYEPSSPDGVYYAHEYADHYGFCVFKDGTVFNKYDTRILEEVGTYSKSGDRWEMKGHTEKQWFLQPTFWGIIVIDPQNHNADEIYTRECFSWAAKSVYWLIDCKEWIQQHIMLR